MGPLVFKTSGTGDPRPVGSIPATSAPDPDPQGGCVKKFLLLMIVVALGAVVAKKKLAA